MLFFYFCTSILVRARTTSKRSLAKAFAPERHLTARVFGKHGLGSLMPPRYMLCLCMCGLSSREKSPHPRVRCLRAPACKGVISSFREFGTSHHLTVPCVVIET